MAPESDERAVLRQLVDRLKARSLSSSAEVLQLLIDPLKLLLTSDDGMHCHSTLTSLLQAASTENESVELAPSTSNRFKSWPADVDPLALRVRMLASAFVEDVQNIIATQLSVTWKDQLGVELWGQIVACWFFPGLKSECAASPALLSSSKPSLIFEVDPKGKTKQLSEANCIDESAAVIFKAGIRTCTMLLSQSSGAAGDGGSGLHLAVKDSVLQAVVVLSQNLHLSGLWTKSAGLRSATKRALEWKDTIARIVALPARVANMTRGKPPEELQEELFLARVSTLFGEMMRWVSQTPGLSEDDTFAASECLSRLIRIGFVSRPAATRDIRHHFWSAIINGLGSEDAKSENLQFVWSQVAEGLPSAERTTFRMSFCTYVEAVWDRDASIGPDVLVAGAERLRAGTEGTLFLSADSVARSIAVARLLMLFFGSLCHPLGSEDCDEEDAEDHFLSLIRDIIIPRVKAQNLFATVAYRPCLSRGIGFWMQLSTLKSPQPTKAHHLDTLMQRVLAIWGNSDIVRVSSRKEEIHITTLLLALLGQLQRIVRKADTKLAIVVAKSLTDLTRMSTFSTGVSARLDHGDHLVRRLGMLVAESITQAAADGAPAEEKLAKLSFGSSIWDGKGEGKEEARVLRSMTLSWYEDGKLETVGDSLKLSQTLGVPSGAKISAEAMGQSQVAITPRRQIPPPKPSGPPAEPRKPLIFEVDEPSVSVVAEPGLRSYASKIEEIESDSSGGSDSSGDEGPQTEPDKLTSAEQALKTPVETRRKPPVYIMQLAPLLRKSDRSANWIGLKFAADLIRKKAGWGGEVDEYAADLCFALVGLQDSHSIKSFEKLRLDALTALLVASPEISVAVVAEQFFHHQYSITQRYAMLNAIAFAALELSGEGKEGASQPDVTALAAKVTSAAVSRAKTDGESHVPSMTREKSLRIDKATAAAAPLVARASFPGALVRPSAKYIDIAARCFVNPLIARTWAHMEESHARGSKSAGGYMGAGAGALFAPTLVARLLQTLSILNHAARHAREFREVLAPQTLSLIGGVANIIFPLAAAHQMHQSQSSDREDAGNQLQHAAAALAVTVLDDAWENDKGQSLVRRHNDLINAVNELAEGIFAVEDARGGAAARPAAAVILRIAEMRDSWRSNVLM